MRIWIVSLFESTPVDNTRPMRFAGIADAAVQRGHHVTHISCTFRHSTKYQRYNETTEVTIGPNFDLAFIYASPYKKNISLKRVHSHREFTKNLMQWSSAKPRPDVLLVTLPPMSSGVALSSWAKKNDIPFVIDIIDPWPDVFLRLVSNKVRHLLKLALAPMYRQLHSILKNSTGLIAISNEYVKWGESFGYSFKHSEAFFPAVKFKEVQSSLVKLRGKVVKPQKLKIIYAGNLASSYDIPTILKAAQILETQYPGKTHFTICGVGPQSALIEQYIRKNTNVEYLGRIGQEDLLKQYATSDLGLTQHIAGATQSITYKFFDYLSAGLPILNSLQSEMATLISNNNLGLNNQPGDADKLAENITYFIQNPDYLDLYKQNAIDFTRGHGDSDVVYSKLVQLLEKITSANHVQ